MYTIYLDFSEELPDGINSIFPLEVGISEEEARLAMMLYSMIYPSEYLNIINRKYVTNHADFERKNPDLVMVMDEVNFTGYWELA